MTDIYRPMPIYQLDRNGPGSGWCAVTAELEFTRADPVAVRLTMAANQKDVQQAVFAFDLLVHISTCRPTGVGLVRFDYDQLDPNFAILRFINEKGMRFTYRIMVSDLKIFVNAVRAVMNVDTHADRVAEALDQAICDILEGSR